MFIFTSWFILAALAGFASNAFNFFTRFVLKGDDDPIAYAWLYETVRFFVFAVLAIFDYQLIITPQSIFFLLGIGVAEWISMYFYMKMHSYTHLSISTIVSRTRLIWVAILAIVIVGESLIMHEFLGIIIIFLGLSIVVSPKKLTTDKGLIYANLAAFLIAIDIIFIKLALPYASNSVINAAMSLPGMLLFPLFMKHPVKRIAPTLKRNFRIKMVAIGFNCLSVFLFALAIRLGDTSKVTAIYQSMMVVSVITGIIFLNERKDIGKKLIGTVVTLFGVVLLTVL